MSLTAIPNLAPKLGYRITCTISPWGCCLQLPLMLLLVPLALVSAPCCCCCCPSSSPSGHSCASIPYPCVTSAAKAYPVLFTSRITQPTGICTLKLSFEFSSNLVVAVVPVLVVRLLS